MSIARSHVSVKQSMNDLYDALSVMGARHVTFVAEDSGARASFWVPASPCCENALAQYQLWLPYPHLREFSREQATGRLRTRARQMAAYEAELRRRWRVLVAATSAKAELIAAGLTCVDAEFAGYAVRALALAQ